MKSNIVYPTKLQQTSLSNYLILQGLGYCKILSWKNVYNPRNPPHTMYIFCDNI
jgi:hypothetical protein